VKILEDLRKAEGELDLQAVIEHIPYTRFLGIQIDQKGTEITTILPFQDMLVGNVNLPAIHGGAIGAFLEVTSIVQILSDTSLLRLPKTVDLSVDYLRSGRPVATYGRAVVTRLGRRVANVRAEIWQEETHKLIAASHGQYLLAPS
jgi:uncharacterized protein (TIGR00369 family)|tara:strand:- start:822 stop:1259 length:438 start_codon:yes stop_codon:yes gene_type:complete